jgi:outer membrane receptor protein involved in Fe transport
MRNIILAALCSLFLTLKAQSQKNSISGTITDSLSHSPLEYATITIYPYGNKVPLTGTVSEKTGIYNIKNIPDGVYTLVFEFIGYNSFTIRDLRFSKVKPVLEKNISLSPVKNTLQTVTVVAQSKLVENRIDKMVYNAEKDITSQSGVAADVLRKIPQVSVDADGNVQLSGSSGVRFLINGKPSTSFGSSITDVLQSIPASQIKSVEVITNPGAKYDAQGLGGIINIILKTNNSRGYNANLSVTLGTRMENGSFNFNARNNNFGFNAFISGNKRLNSKTPYISDRVTSDSNGISGLHQEGTGMLGRHGSQAGIGFDWTVKKLNNFTGSLSYNSFGYTGSGTTNQDYQVKKGSTIPPVLSFIHTSSDLEYKNLDAGLNYKRTFAKEDQELDVGVNSSFGNIHNESANEQYLLPHDSLFYGSRSFNPGKEKEVEVNIDYTQPLQKDVLLGIGTKASFYDIHSESDISRYQPALQSYVGNASLSNNLTYNQKVYALYAELSFPVASWFETKLGGRYERTEIHSYYSNALQPVKVPGYDVFVPSIFFMKKLGDANTIKLSYSKRIERPEYMALNPFVNTNDPKNLSAGNPFLEPEIGHRFELGYNRSLGKVGSFMASLFYRLNENDIQPYFNYYPSYKAGDSIYTNVAVSTRQNIGTEKNMGLNLFGDLQLSTKFNMRGNVFLFRRHTINTVDDGFNSTSFNYRFNLNGTYQFNKTLLAEFFGNFNSARHEAQGTYPSFTTYSMAIRKQFWDKKGSLALTANNFLSEYVRQKTILTGPGFYLNSTRKIPFRSIGLNFTWKFGKLEFKNPKSENDSNNTPPVE